MREHNKILLIDNVSITPGMAPDHTPVSSFVIRTANYGDLEWLMTPGQARQVAQLLSDYASVYKGRCA